MDYSQFTLDLAGLGGLFSGLLLFQAGIWKIRRLIALAKGLR